MFPDFHAVFVGDSPTERLGEDFFNQLRKTRVESSLRPLIVAMGTRGDVSQPRGERPTGPSQKLAISRNRWEKDDDLDWNSEGGLPLKIRIT